MPETNPQSDSPSGRPLDPRRDPKLAALEAALGGLVPAAPRLDRDRLMYEAGAAAVQAAAPTLRRSWSTALAMCAGLAGIAAAMGMAAWLHQSGRELSAARAELAEFRRAQAPSPGTPEIGPGPITSSAAGESTVAADPIPAAPAGIRGTYLFYRAGIASGPFDAIWSAAESRDAGPPPLRAFGGPSSDK